MLFHFWKEPCNPSFESICFTGLVSLYLRIQGYPKVSLFGLSNERNFIDLEQDYLCMSIVFRGNEIPLMVLYQIV